MANSLDGCHQVSDRAFASQLLRDLIRALGRRYGVVILLTSLLGLTTLLPAQLFRYFAQSSQALTTLNAQDFIYHFVLFGFWVSIALFLSSVASSLVHEWLRLTVEASLRERVLQRLQDTPVSWVDGSSRGDWFTRVTGDLSRTEMFLTESIPNQLRDVAVILGVSALFIAQSGWLALLPLVSAIGIGVTHAVVQRRLSPTLFDLRGLHARIFQMLIESFEGIRTIRVQKAESFFLRRFRNNLSEITTKSMRVVRYIGALMGGTELIGQLLITLCLSAVAFSLIRNDITLEQALTYPFFIGIFYLSVARLASSTYDWNRFQIEAGRLGAFLYREITDLRCEQTPDVSDAGRFSLSEVEVGYPNGPKTRPISFSIQHGECFAVVGPSGVGKSTFLEALAGLNPALGGRATIIQASGTELWSGSASQIPIGLCAYVEQRPYIFEGNLRDNLTFGNPTRHSDVVLWDALSRVGLDALVENRGGLNSFILDRGRNLSEGERYRLALCRVLLEKRPFLLVDEPFAALDTQSLEIVVAALNRERPNSGILVVTHFIPQSLDVDAVIDFTHYQVQRRESSLCRPEGLPSEEGKRLPLPSLEKRSAISKHHIERRIT